MKFRLSPEFVIDSELEPWCREGLRFGMFGGPGSGKSYNDALLIEQFLQQGGTVVVFQPRDEYFTLKEKFDILSVGGVHAKDIEFALTSPATYAKAVVENGVSMIFYTSDVEDEEKLVDWVTRFLQAIMKLEEVHHRPLLIIPEESQEYLPNNPKGHVCPPWTYNRMIKAFKDLSTQGRKLNIIPVVSSQRPQDVNFDARQLANVTFYGRFSSHDAKYVDKEVLETVRKLGVDVHAEALTRLGKAEWLVVYGNDSKYLTVTEKRLTKHGADTPSLEYVAPHSSEVKATVDDLAKSIMAALEQEKAEGSELEKTKRKLRETEKRLEDAEEKANIKLNLKEMMQPAAPSKASLQKGLEEIGQLAELQLAKRNAEEALETERKANAEIKEYVKTLTEDFNKKTAVLTTELEGSKKYGLKITAMEAERCDQLEEAHRELKAFENLRLAFADLMPAPVVLDEAALTKLVGPELFAKFKDIAEEVAVKEMAKYAGSKVPQDGAAAVSVTESIPVIEHKIERPIVQTSDATRDGQLITLACHGFFDEERRLAEIAKELDRWFVFSTHNASRDLTPILGQLVVQKVLQRKVEGNGWVYLLADGAKERIKEAS